MGKSEVYVLSVKRRGEFYDSSPPEVDLDNVGLQVKDDDEIENPFIGMGKEELLKYSSQPCWRRFRGACVALVLLGWLALLVSVVTIVLLYPKCKAAESRSWWQKDVMYRIYVPSFKDSNGDGKGDLKGIESKLDYIKDLGVGSISLSPVYKTDSVDSDFGITDHQDVHPDYGTLDDMADLIKAAHAKGIRIIMDFIPNQTSKNHTWFTMSSQSTALTNTYRNFYTWTDTTNNWKALYGGEAWTSDATRNQNFLHQMRVEQPDLNLRSSQVQEELEKILQFWLAKGVDGFYIRHSPFLFEDYDMRDESKKSSATGNGYDDYIHEYTYNLPEVHDMIARWRMLLKNDSSDNVLLADIHSTDMNAVMSYYGAFQRDGAHLTLNLNFLRTPGSCNGSCMNLYVDDWMRNLPTGRWANWMAGNENSDRLATRFEEPFIRSFYLVTMLLPGTPIIYYGDEIMLQNVQEPMTVNLGNRPQNMRTVMQWSGAYNAGFSNNDTCENECISWLKVNNYTNNNVETQQANPDSLFMFIKNVTKYRQKTTFTAGTYHKAVTDDSIFSFVREFNGENGYLVAVNFGTQVQTRNFAGSYSGIETEATVDLVVGSNTENSVEDTVDTTEITLKPLEGIVVYWDFVAKEEF